MAASDSLALEFEAHRPHPHSVAYRILGSAGDGRITAIDLIGDPAVLSGPPVEMAA